MFYDEVIRGLPPAAGTLSLTYDDGPGPHTADIGEFLAEEGVRATFFVLGMNVHGRERVIERLHQLGHLIGNHTYHHPRLPALAAAGRDVALDLLRAHDVIAAAAGGAETRFFRPPHGDWNVKDSFRSPVAVALNGCARLRGYVGPIGWDVDGADWKYWLEGRSVAECERRYMREIAAAGGGIVLMHDGSEYDELSRVNETFELTRRLVAVLKGAGYRFVRLDELSHVRDALAAAGAGE
jgi:peptidoglycan/xylan/chitin deacetylase (PgdA/CDA1 family)